MGITQAEVEAIRVRWERNAEMQRTDFLRKWKDKVGQSGTYRELCETFCRIGVTSYALKLYDILCSEKRKTTTTDSLVYTSASNSQPGSFPPHSQTLFSPPIPSIFYPFPSCEDELERDCVSTPTVQQSRQPHYPLGRATLPDSSLPSPLTPYEARDIAQQASLGQRFLTTDFKPLVSFSTKAIHQKVKIRKTDEASEHSRIACQLPNYSGNSQPQTLNTEVPLPPSSIHCMREDQLSKHARTVTEILAADNIPLSKGVKHISAFKDQECRHGTHKDAVLRSHSPVPEHQQLRSPVVAMVHSRPIIDMSLPACKPIQRDTQGGSHSPTNHKDRAGETVITQEPPGIVSQHASCSAVSQEWAFESAFKPETSIPAFVPRCTADDYLNQDANVLPVIDSLAADNPPPPKRVKYVSASPGLASVDQESRRSADKHPVLPSHSPMHVPEYQQLRTAGLLMMQPQFLSNPSVSTYTPGQIPHDSSVTRAPAMTVCSPKRGTLARPPGQYHSPLHLSQDRVITAPLPSHEVRSKLSIESSQYPIIVGRSAIPGPSSTAVHSVRANTQEIGLLSSSLIPVSHFTCNALVST